MCFKLINTNWPLWCGSASRELRRGGVKAISRRFLGHLLCEMGPQRRCSLGSGTKELPRAGEGRRTVAASSEDIVNVKRWRDVNLPFVFQNKESPRDVWMGYLEGDLAVSALVMSWELSVNINSRQEKIRRFQISVLNPDRKDSEGFISVGTFLLGAQNICLSASCWLENIVRYLHPNLWI